MPLYITQLPTVTKNEDGSFDIVGGKAGFVQGTGFSTDVDGELLILKMLMEMDWEQLLMY